MGLVVLALALIASQCAMVRADVAGLSLAAQLDPLASSIDALSLPLADRIEREATYDDGCRLVHQFPGVIVRESSPNRTLFMFELGMPVVRSLLGDSLLVEVVNFEGRPSAMVFAAKPTLNHMRL